MKRAGISAGRATKLRSGRPGSIPGNGKTFFFSSVCPDRLWGALSHLFTGHKGPPHPTVEIKRPGREGDHSPPSSAEFRNEWSYTSTPQSFCHGVHSDF